MQPDFSIIFSGIVTLSTVVYAALTVFLVRETRRMRKVQTEPRIDVTVRVREEWIGHIDIVIANIGLGPAYGLHFQADPVTDDRDTQLLMEELLQINLVRSGLHYLSPGQQATSFLTNLTENPAFIRCAFQVTATYKNAVGRKYKHEYRIDFSEFIGLRRVGEPPLHKLAKTLEALQTDVHKLVAHEIRSSR